MDKLSACKRRQSAYFSGMNWKTYLKPSEVDRLAELAGGHRAIVQERRRIYDRCRKRMAKDTDA